ncbi:MAG TPA: hypothetical protein VGW38_26860, partial [Chloroflexota bacterium]|nr:hypothetical protein [Chloroflexota bacterium]
TAPPAWMDRKLNGRQQEVQQRLSPLWIRVPSAGQTGRGLHGWGMKMVRYLVIRTAAFVALTLASTTVMALPYLLS